MNASCRDPGLEAGRLLLLVTGDAPRSRRARANLSAALNEHGSALAPAEVDLLEEPERTIEYGVFATPALLWLRGDGRDSVIYGDLSDPSALHSFLRAIPCDPPAGS